eukprot:6431436-Prymnesium_polylepis.2
MGMRTGVHQIWAWGHGRAPNMGMGVLLIWAHGRLARLREAARVDNAELVRLPEAVAVSPARRERRRGARRKPS